MGRSASLHIMTWAHAIETHVIGPQGGQFAEDLNLGQTYLGCFSDLQSTQFQYLPGTMQPASPSSDNPSCGASFPRPPPMIQRLELGDQRIPCSEVCRGKPDCVAPCKMLPSKVGTSNLGSLTPPESGVEEGGACERRSFFIARGQSNSHFSIRASEPLSSLPSSMSNESRPR